MTNAKLPCQRCQLETPRFEMVLAKNDLGFTVLLCLKCWKARVSR